MVVCVKQRGMRKRDLNPAALVGCVLCACGAVVAVPRALRGGGVWGRGLHHLNLDVWKVDNSCFGPFRRPNLKLLPHIPDTRMIIIKLSLLCLPRLVF